MTLRGELEKLWNTGSGNIIYEMRSSVCQNIDELEKQIIGLGLHDSTKRVVVVRSWSKESEVITAHFLVPLLFKIDENLDSGIIQVLVNKGVWGITLLIEKAFSVLNDKTLYPGLSSYNTKAIAKYTAQRPEITLPVFLDCLTKKEPNEPCIWLFERFMFMVKKLKKSQLQGLDKEILYHLGRGNYLKHIFTSVPEALYQIEEHAYQIMRKIDQKLFLGDVYIEDLIERILDAEGGILSKIVSGKWIERFRRLAQQYNGIRYKNDFEAWLDEYSIWLYELLCEEPKAFVGRWDDECILRSKPISSESSRLAWKLVETYGIIDMATNKFKEWTLGYEIYEALLAFGDLKALNIFKNLIMEKGITPTYNLCMSFRRLLVHRSGGLENYDQKLSDAYFAIGKRWEELCRNVARLLYGEILIQPKLANGKVPDIVPQGQTIIWNQGRITDAPKMIECKKNISVDVIEDVLGKYSLYCRNLELWVLQKNEGNLELANVTGLHIIYASELMEIILDKDQKLAEQICELEKQTHSEEIDKSLLDNDFIKDSPKVTEDILELNRFLQPFYKELNPMGN